MKAYNEGLGQYVHVEIVSRYEAQEFNEQLARKLNDGWRVVQGVEVTRMPDNKTMSVIYTCMIAKTRSVAAYD